MLVRRSEFFTELYDNLADDLVHAPTVTRGEWQSIDVSASTLHTTHELGPYVLVWSVPSELMELQAQVQPSLPWAEDHFLERVSGIPYNPPPSHVDWPWAKRNNGDHTGDAGKFSHTYPERFWPRWARISRADRSSANELTGIRYPYGDLADVVQLLREAPMSRQAYLPVWFPEDTGGHVRLGARVPCSLGYHFLMRSDWTLDINYFMRSCDMVRHFRNDVYLAARLLQWVIAELADEQEIKPGTLTMFVSSMHVMVGDVPTLRPPVG